MQVLRFLLIFINLEIILCQWIDPHSMDTFDKEKLPKNSYENSVHCKPTIQKNCNSDLYLKRIIRLILSNAYLHKEFDSYEGYINIVLNSKDYKLLEDFSQNTYTDNNIYNEIGTIFDKAFEKPSSDKYPEMILSMQQNLYDLLFNTTSTALYGAVIVLFTIYRLVKADFTWWSIFKYILSLTYITDFLITYLNIIREEEIENMVKIKELGATPPECDPQKMSWLGFIKSQFESNLLENPCKSYYLATYPSYTYVIAPSKILIRQFRTLIVEPFGDIGEAFGKFGRGMFTSLPWGLNIVIFPIMLVCFCSLTFILFLFITKPKFKISLFHLFSIELGDSNKTQSLPTSEFNRRRIEYRNKSKKNIKEVGFTSNHRDLVEEVSNNNSSRDNPNEKKVTVLKKQSVKDVKKEETKTKNIPVSDSEFFKEL